MLVLSAARKAEMLAPDEPDSPGVLSAQNAQKETDCEGREHHEAMRAATDMLRSAAAVLYKERPKKTKAPKVPELKKPEQIGYANVTGITGKRMTVKDKKSDTLTDDESDSEGVSEADQAQADYDETQEEVEDDEEDGPEVHHVRGDSDGGGSSSDEEPMFDVSGAKEAVGKLLSNLQSGKKTNVLNSLDEWFQESTKHVSANVSELDSWEGG